MYLLQHSHFLNAVCLITELFFVPASAPYNGIIESLFVCVWGGGGGEGQKGGADLRLGGPRGRHRNDIFPPSHLLCTIESQMEGPMV